MTDEPTTPPNVADHPLRPATTAVSAGRPPHTPDSPMNPPVTFASNFVAGGDLEYSRYANPSWDGLEEVIGALEGGRALAFASGMAAISAVLDLVATGETVVAPRHCYSGTMHALAGLEQRGLLKLELVDISDRAAVVAALGDDVALLWVESPTNPALEVADIAALAAAARERSIPLVVDNTFATPLLQQPLALGADVVVHSATKGIAGHSDVLIGLVVTARDDIYQAVLERRSTAGAVPGPMEAWLALRGARTLHLRVERASANARILAERLSGHPSVERVRDPGWGTILAIEVKGGAMAADLVVHSTRLWVHATSLGGVESTLERRRRWSLEQPTIPENLIRLSVGVEDVEDLWSDLSAALASS